jgi:arylsulfatase A-like enzyme
MHGDHVVDNFTPLDPKLPSFPALLRDAGYRTAFMGKWQMGGQSGAASTTGSQASRSTDQYPGGDMPK